MKLTHEQYSWLHRRYYDNMRECANSGQFYDASEWHKLLIELENEYKGVISNEIIS